MLNRVAGVCMVAAVLVLTGTACGQVFSNTASISIPESGVATPYPSVITVSGVTNPAKGLRVRLKGFSHTYPSDNAVLLVAPNGQGYQLLNFTGGSVPISNVSLTFAAETNITLPARLESGTYQASGGGTGFNAPAQAVPRAASLLALAGGGNANGDWKLYVQDFGAGDLGAFAGGWELEFGDFGSVIQSLPGTTFTYQGRLDGAPANGVIDARFTVWANDTSVATGDRVAGPVTVSGIPLANGTFSVPVDLGANLPGDRKTWLQVEVASPSGGAFTSLTPRQAFTATPLAMVAAGLARNTVTPDVAFIGGRQVDGVSLNDTSLTIQAPGQPGFSGFGTNVGELRLRGGSGNNAASSPTPGLSNGGDVALYAGQNFWTNRGWNGNIRFHGGNNQPELMRIVGDNGNVGIGTTTPAAKLDVRGEVKFGATGNLSPVASQVAQRISAGIVNASGTLQNGVGFTPSRTSAGVYRVTWTAADGFTATPAVLVTVLNGAADVVVSVTDINVSPDGSGSAGIQFRKTDVSFVDVSFSVMIVGKR